MESRQFAACKKRQAAGLIPECEMLQVLLIAETTVLLVGLPLLWLFLKERVKNLAREESERTLADYRHQHELALAALAAERQRSLYEYSLFAARQHKVLCVAVCPIQKGFRFVLQPNWYLHRSRFREVRTR